MIKPKKHYRISEITKRARHLRNNATGAEKLLWTRINRKQASGYKFRRQHPFGLYVLDFYCVDLKLCVELDGDQHGFGERLRKDLRRSEYLEAHGIEVLRFWNIQIFENIDGVVETIMEKVRMRKYAVKNKL